MSFVQANTNGQLHDPDAPTLSPLDRGFLYGDAVYEVWRSYRGVLFGVEAHWERLQGSARDIGLELPFTRDAAFEQIRQTVQAWRRKTSSREEVYVRMQISRGGGAIGLDPDLADTPNFVILVKAQPDLDEHTLDHGYTLAIPKTYLRNSVRSLPPSLKTGNYLNNILGLREARGSGADDAAFLNHDGAFTETSTRNLWFVFKDKIVTPRLEDGILAGVTRRLLLEKLETFERHTLVEATVKPAELEHVQECFLSSTTQDIQPVRKLDHFSFATGPATLSRKLKSEFRRWTSNYAHDHVEWRL